MKKKFEAHATVSEWTDDEGKKCKRTLHVGTVFESSAGRLVMKLDAVPTSRDWSGWLSLKSCVQPSAPGRRLPPGFPPAPPAED